MCLFVSLSGHLYLLLYVSWFSPSLIGPGYSNPYSSDMSSPFSDPSSSGSFDGLGGSSWEDKNVRRMFIRKVNVKLVHYLIIIYPREYRIQCIARSTICLNGKVTKYIEMLSDGWNGILEWNAIWWLQCVLFLFPGVQHSYGAAFGDIWCCCPLYILVRVHHRNEES